MLVVLKIPVVYMCAVVWWAIRAEPRPLAGAQVRTPLDPPPGCDWKRRNGPRRLGPHGGGLVRARRAPARMRRTVGA